MPVTEKKTEQEPLYQRAQYAKGGIARRYWDYRDSVALSLLEPHDSVIVDIGCGEGITLEKIAGMFPSAEVTGIDSMQENVDICLKHGLPARPGSVYELDCDDDTADAVVFMEVIEHLKDPEAALREIHRIMKPGGRLITVFPNDRLFMIARLLTFKFREAFYDPGHLKQWSPGKAQEILQRSGFSVFFSRAIPFRYWFLSLHGVIGACKVIPNNL